jgi:hypothetical protein
MHVVPSASKKWRRGEREDGRFLSNLFAAVEA